MHGEIKIRDGAIIADPGENGLAVAQDIARELGLSHLTIVQPGAPNYSEHGQRDFSELDRRVSSPNGGRFRERRELTQQEDALHDKIKATATVLEVLIEHTPRGRYQMLALNALEQSIFWARQGLTE